jgi:hypothetical protein
MGRARHRTTYRLDPSRSENTADAADWLYNFDESALDTASVPDKYRKVVGETVVEMTDQEKADVEKPAALAAVTNRTKQLALAELYANYDAANGNVEATAKAAINAATTPAEVTTAKALDGR